MAERMVTQADPLARVLAFFDEFRAAPNDADIEVRIGSTEKGEAAVIISINGKRHAFTTSEARKMAAIAEKAMRESPNDPASATLPNLIMALRFGADKADGSPDAR